MKKFYLAEDLAGDLNRLIDTRLLIQANSGGGKSWCLRRLLEQTHGAVQHLVIDPEGEFASLRERFDYVLAVKQGGDTAAEPRTGALLAERLLELGVSAILDLYELKAHDRVRFVRVFLEALIDAPKKLWHPALVVVDEAHVYCPEKDEAESAGAVKDLATRGRKRGFCAVLATQRLAKLHKDAAAECNNKLIGRTSLDVDLKRASDDLGFRGRDRWPELRALDNGEFFAFGPALSSEVRKVKIGPVLTTHPKAGARLAFAPAPPPTDKIKALLPKLSDLPAESEKKARREADLRGEIRSLKEQLRARPSATVEKAVEKRVEIQVLKDKIVSRLERQVAALKERGEQLEARASELRATASEIAGTLRAFLARPAPARPSQMSAPRPAAALRPAPRLDPPLPAGDGDARLNRGERAVLTAIAQHEAGVTREQLTVLTGYRRSTRDTYLQRLGAAGLVELVGDRVVATSGGVEALGTEFEPLPTGDDLRAHWMTRLPEGERKILGILIESYPEAVDRDLVSEKTGYARSSRDTYLQRLTARRLVEIAGRAAVRASELLFG